MTKWWNGRPVKWQMSFLYSLLMPIHQCSHRLDTTFTLWSMSLAVNRLLVIRPFGLWKLAPIVICSDIKEVPDVSSAQARRSFDEQQLRRTPLISNTVCNCSVLLCISHAVWKQELAKNSPYQPVSCSSTGCLSCTWWQNAPVHGSVPYHHQCALWRGRAHDGIQWVDEYVRNSQAKHKPTKILNLNCFVFDHTNVRWSNSYVWCGLQQHQGAQPNPVWTYGMTVYNCLTSTQPGTLSCQCQLI